VLRRESFHFTELGLIIRQKMDLLGKTPSVSMAEQLQNDQKGQSTLGTTLDIPVGRQQ
jgi:hypothetical protein